MKIHRKVDYRPVRKQAYPDIGDQLDALFELAIYLRESGHTLPDKTAQWLDACLQVKARFQKH